MKYTSDKELILMLRAGDMKGYEILFMRHYMRVLLFVKGIVKNDWVSEDLAQNVFMKIWIMRDTLYGNSIHNLLFRIARNEVTDHFRSQSHVMRYRQKNDLRDREESFEEDYYAAEMQEKIDRSVETLTPRQREIYRMSRQEHLSDKEIANRLDLSVRTVEKHLETALKQIREEIREII